LYFRDLEAAVVQVKSLPVFLEGSEVFTDVVPFFGSSMPEIADDRNRSFLALVLENSLEIFPGYVRWS
jgi:hypothetical protein